MRFLKRVFVPFLVLTVLITFTPNVHAVGRPSVSAHSALIVDYKTGKILYSKNRNMRVLPASTVKLLTAMVVLDRLSLTSRISVSRKAALAPKSKIFIHQGGTYSVADLTKAIIISSANDAALALAEGVSGTEMAFSRLMNKKARQLGLTNSHFTNASGLPDDNMYTTAADMAKVTKAAYQYPFIRRCMQSRYQSARHSNGKKIRLKNHNRLLWSYPIKVFGKTGYTRKAMHCFASIAQYRGKKVIMVMFKSKKKWKDIQPLIEYGVGYQGLTASAKKKIQRNKANLKKKEVIRVQRALNKAGFNPGGIDGIFGVQTLNALTLFQQHYRLEADGIVGPRTLSKLKRFMR